MRKWLQPRKQHNTSPCPLHCPGETNFLQTHFLACQGAWGFYGTREICWRNPPPSLRALERRNAIFSSRSSQGCLEIRANPTSVQKRTPASPGNQKTEAQSGSSRSWEKIRNHKSRRCQTQAMDTSKIRDVIFSSRSN